MKTFYKICILLLAASSWAWGQNPEFKSGIVFKKLFLDYQSQNGGKFEAFKAYQHGYEIGYQRMLGSNLALNFPLRFGVVNSHVDSITLITKNIISLDAQIQYHFNQAGNKIFPYVLAGVGGVYERVGDFNVQIPAGLGLYIRLADRAYVTLQSEFRYALKDKRNNFQHGIGFTYLLGPPLEKEPILPKDSDGDGVPDTLDDCPFEFGSKEANGCPDKDGDGVPDYKDKCPDVKGLRALEGCPDSDGDGVPDHLDKCPDVKGTKANNGCPENVIKDRDGDGVPDDKDECPDEPGTIDTNGCPDRDRDGIPDKDDKCPDKPGLRIYSGCPDTDGDGIPDHLDECPNVPGSVANNGCPEIKKEDKKTLDIAMQAVQFQVGSAVLKPESHRVLNQIAGIMAKYPDFNMQISGHTDNTGNPTLNQNLSEKRAKACYDYLVKEGVDPMRMTHTGYGESRPISTNDNEKGRTLNRRVEFILVPRNR